MEIWQTLQEELNRLYEMFVQRNPYFEANGGKVSIAAHSLGCVVTYDILTGWTQGRERPFPRDRHYSVAVLVKEQVLVTPFVEVATGVYYLYLPVLNGRCAGCTVWLWKSFC